MVFDLSTREGNIRLEGHQNTPVAGHDKDSVTVLVVNDFNCVGLRRDFAEQSIDLLIKDENRTFSTAIANEAASCLRDHAMRTLLPRNVGDNLPRNGVDHHRVGGSWNIESVVVGIEGHAIPAARTSDVKGLDDGPTALE